MNNFTNPLDNIKVASPCSADWNEMNGNERQRFCGSCQKSVYNLSGMTKPEAENLLLNAEGRVCVRFYQRADGTILTQDCPVGWAAFRRRLSQTATALASLLFGIIGGLGMNSYFKAEKAKQWQTMGEVVYNPTPTPSPTPAQQIIMGEMMQTPPRRTAPKNLQPTIKKIINSPGN